MIRKEDKEMASELRQYLYKQMLVPNTKNDGELDNWIDLIYRMVNNLEKAPMSYRPATLEDQRDHYYTVECGKCGWWGSSKLLEGGHAIGDTGDYSDVYCPVCGNIDVEERACTETILQVPIP